MTENEANARIRFDDFEFEEHPDGSCSARVVLSWDEGRRFTASADGIVSELGVLRCAAEAAARALELAVDNRAQLELQGVTTIKAFDTAVVVVSIASTIGGRTQRVVGSTVIDGDPGRAAVRAVLSSTNRLFEGNMIFLR